MTRISKPDCSRGRWRDGLSSTTWGHLVKSLCLVVICVLICAAVASDSVAQTVTLEDTFSRPDSTDLGVTEVGSAPYVELNLFGGPQLDVADIFDSRLSLYGTAGFTERFGGLVSIDEDLDDLTMSADLRFESGLLFTEFEETGTSNFGGFRLRGGPLPGNNEASEGQVDVNFYPGGYMWIQEIQNGIPETLYSANPFNPAGSTGADFSMPGQLPTMIGGQPFDADGDGALEPNEPFNFSVSLVGDALDVSVNGSAFVSVNTAGTESVGFGSKPGFFKKFAGDVNLEQVNIGIDNVEITGQAYDPPPVPFALPELGDVVHALNTGNVTQSLQVVRGDLVSDGGMQAPFKIWNSVRVTEVEFDNFDGVRRNANGNLLGISFAGDVYSLSTTDAQATEPQVLSTQDNYVASGITDIAVNPANNTVALTGILNGGGVIFADYTPGNTAGSGGALSNFRETAVVGAVAAAVGVTWLDDDEAVIFNPDGELLAVDSTSLATTTLADLAR